MRAFLLVFIFSMLVTSWLTASGPPVGAPIGVRTVVETASGMDRPGEEAIPDFYLTPETRDAKIITDLHSTGTRVGDDGVHFIVQ